MFGSRIRMTNQTKKIIYYKSVLNAFDALFGLITLFRSNIAQQV